MLSEAIDGIKLQPLRECINMMLAAHPLRLDKRFRTCAWLRSLRAIDEELTFLMRKYTLSGMKEDEKRTLFASGMETRSHASYPLFFKQIASLAREDACRCFIVS